MILVVGLGNRDVQYTLTRHNTGFMAIDYLTNCHNLKIELHKKSNTLLATALVPDLSNQLQNVIFAKPQTYMNLSGTAVSYLANYYKIPHNKILVIHDDVDVRLGKVKFKIGGGSAGHNGLKSIDQVLGNDYCRLRIGIGKPTTEMELSNYVLGKFHTTEMDILQKLLTKITDILPIFISGQLEIFHKNINSL